MAVVVEEGIEARIVDCGCGSRKSLVSVWKS